MATSWMVYLYFSSLNTSSNQSDQSLRLAVQNAGLVLSFQHDKSVLDILSGQDLFGKIIGEEKEKSMRSLRESLNTPAINAMIQNQNIFISFYPGASKNLEFMLSVMVNPEVLQKDIALRLAQSKVVLKPKDDFYALTLPDSSQYYLAIKDRVLLIASSPEIIKKVDEKQSDDNDQGFISFIQKNDRLAKNSLASLYINYNLLPALMKSVTPFFNRGELALLNNQNAYARLSYNFSKERIFLNGETKVENQDSYFSLFQSLKPEKIDLDKILPDNTASYTLYAFGDFKHFSSALNGWFKHKKEEGQIKKQIQSINDKYRLNLDEIFPSYTGTQAVTFILKNKQKLAAVKLTNGEKVNQLLLDLSDDYDGKIRIFKEPDILYYYFGEPFKKFERPYYLILNNLIILAPYASSLQDFQNKYQRNELLIMDPTYSDVFNQLPLTSNVLFYLNNKSAQNIVINTVYASFYDHYRKENGLKSFETFVYQLGGDEGSFQTNLLLNTKSSQAQEASKQRLDSLNLNGVN